MGVRSFGRVLVGVSVVSLLLAGIALAAKPVNGKTYSGTVTGDTTQTVSFTVAKNGKSLGSLNVPIAIRCAGGFGGIGLKAPKKIAISSKGTFKATLKAYGAGNGKSFGKETVTGKFLAGSKEAGKIKGALTGLSSCHNVTLKYTTTAT